MFGLSNWVGDEQIGLVVGEGVKFYFKHFKSEKVDIHMEMSSRWLDLLV